MASVSASSSTMASVSASSSTTSTVSTVSLSFSSDKSKTMFMELGSEGFGFTVNNTDYVFLRTKSGGFVIQPQSDFEKSEKTGFYVSHDFTTMISDNTKNTDAAIREVITKVSSEITYTVTSSVTLQTSSST